MLDRYKNCDKWVLVGSSALYLRGLLDRLPNDYDIATTKVETFADSGLKLFKTFSPFSITGQRASGVNPDDKKILDIFVNTEIIPYETIKGYRVATVQNELEYYRGLLPVVNPVFTERIKKYIEIYERNY